MKNLLALATIALAVSTFGSNVAQADELDAVLSVPQAVVNDGIASVVPVIDLSKTVPSADEVRAVPNPADQPLIEYPIHVIQYGLNLYPTSRIIRHNLFPSR